MSHYMKITTTLFKESAICETANRLGFVVSRNNYCRGYNGQTTKCDLVINLPGQYDVGFQKTNGGYEMIADFWANHISSYLANPDVLDENPDSNEAKISKFQQLYNQVAIEHLIQEQGFHFQENTLEDGTIVLEVMGV